MVDIEKSDNRNRPSLKKILFSTTTRKTVSIMIGLVSLIASLLTIQEMMSKSPSDYELIKGSDSLFITSGYSLADGSITRAETLNVSESITFAGGTYYLVTNELIFSDGAGFYANPDQAQDVKLYIAV